MGVSERKEREKKRRREDILDAAEKVFFEKGIDLATMEDVALTAELSKATLYLYFSSKEEIYFAIFVRGQKKMAEMMLRTTRSLQHTREKINGFAKSVFSFQKKYPDYFKAFIYFQTHGINISGESIYLAEHQRTRQILLDTWIGLMKDGKQEAIISKQMDEMRTGAILWMQMLGFLMIYPLMKNDMKSQFHFSDRNIVEDYTDLVLNGILKK